MLPNALARISSTVFNGSDENELMYLVLDLMGKTFSILLLLILAVGYLDAAQNRVE